MLLPRLFLFLFTFASVAFGADWVTYEKCTLEKSQYFDGDSFEVRTKSPTTGKEYTYIFRLYGADCPETDTRYPERLATQAKEFSRPVGEMVRWGEKARDFSEKFLSRPFTVITSKQDARGASQKPRYYAIVFDAEGRDLAETLIRSGFARAYGMWPNSDPPKIPDGPRYRQKLERAESQARTAGAGIWSKPGTTPSALPGATPSLFKSKLPFQQ